MVGRCLLICTFLLLINKVSLENTVAVEGDTIIFLCSNSAGVLERKDMNVHWRYNNSLVVYDIIKGNEFVENQNPTYRGRVESFPDKYSAGDFSIKLSSVKTSDRGTYNCFLPLFQSTEIKLQVQPAPPTTSRAKNKATGSRSVLSFLVFIVLLVNSLL